MICSACGHESPAGNRFCGMCGTPLPHRPLDTPGAQGTMNLTRGPLENPQPAKRISAVVDIAGAQQPHSDELTIYASAGETPRPDEAVSPGLTGLLGDTSKQVPALFETPPEHPDRPADLPPDSGTVSEDPLQAFAEDLDHPQLHRPEEMATGGTLDVPSAVLAFADALPPVESSAPLEAEHFPWMEDVLQQLVELEAAKPSERPDEPPAFLNLLDELTPPPVEPEPHASTVVASSFSEVSEVPQTMAGSDVITAVEQSPSKKWRLWLATAAVLVFAVLGTMLWWPQVNRISNGLIASIERKIRDLKPSNPMDTNKDQLGMSAGSAEPNASSPAIRTEEQPKPQGQSGTASATALPTAPDGRPETTKTAVPATVVSQVQSPPATGSNSATSRQVSSEVKTQPAEQKPVPTYPPATTGSSQVTAPQPTAKAAPPAIEKPKPVPQAARNEDRGVAVKKVIPGNFEMTKAKEASDTDAQVAWLWKATAKGNPEAPLRLADMYIKGDVVPRSCVQAIVLLRTAALDDNEEACNRLASMYTVGLCVSRNHVKAYRWLSSAIAADPSSQTAQENRDLIWQQMTPEEQALAEKYRQATMR